jgi:hypothetical protein
LLNAALSLNACTINGNTANYGGGVHITNATPLVIDDCEFSNNDATSGSGGGLFTKNTSVTILGGSFDNNDSGINGAPSRLKARRRISSRTLCSSAAMAGSAGSAISTLPTQDSRLRLQGNTAHDASAACGRRCIRKGTGQLLFNQNQAVGVGSDHGRCIQRRLHAGHGQHDRGPTTAFGGGAVHESARATMHIANRTG